MITAVRGEWTKIRATLAPKICALLALAFGVGFPVLIAFAVRGLDADSIDGTDAAGIVTAGVSVSMVTLMVMVAIAVTAEYRFGMIRMSLAATPRRGRFMAAKLAVLSAITVVVGAAIAPIAYVVVNPILDGSAVGTISLGDEGVPRILVGVPLVLLVAALIAGAVAFAVRSPAAAIASVVIWAIVIEPILGAAPWVREHVGPYLPFNATGRLLTIGSSDPDQLSPWTGYAVGWLWALAFLGLGFAVLRKRDA